MTVQKLQAMIIRNLEERVALTEQKAVLAEGGEDDSGDDPEMIDQKLYVHL